jgi:hypothetical protein
VNDGLIPAAPGQHDEKRYADFGTVETFTVLEEIMLSQSLAVVGGYDHECLLENAPALQFAEQRPELIVQISKAVVIAIDDESSVVSA